MTFHYTDIPFLWLLHLSHFFQWSDLSGCFNG